jgi:hypothetical protein
MSEPTPRNPAHGGARHRQPEAQSVLPPIVCSRCGGPIVHGQQVGPLFSGKLVRWSEQPVLSKPPVIRGIIRTDGSPGRVEMSVGDQLKQRAANGRREGTRRARRVRGVALEVQRGRACRENAEAIGKRAQFLADAAVKVWSGPRASRSSA